MNNAEQSKHNNAVIEDMDKRLSEVETTVSNIDKNMTQVREAILGNALTKQGGILLHISTLESRIIILEAKVAKQESFTNRIIWISGFLMGLLGTIAMLVSLYKDFVSIKG